MGKLQLTELEFGGEQLVVASFDLPSGVDRAALSAAEMAVARLVLDGLSNRAIASRRGASVRTIANQIASIYRKLGVHSRVELAAELARATRAGS